MPKTSRARRRGRARGAADAPGQQRRRRCICSGQSRGATKASVCSAPREPARRQRRSADASARARQLGRRSRALLRRRAVTLNQRTAPPRVSITANTRPPTVHRLAAPRHAAELVRDQAADGVELVGRQRDAEGLVDRVDRRRRRRRAGCRRPACRCSTRRRCSSNSSSISPTISSSTSSIVIRPGGVAELVDDDRQVVAVDAEVAQQVVQALRLGHEDRRPQQRAQVQVGRALQLQQVLGHQDADDVVALALEDRKARVAGVDDDVQQLVVAARRCRAGPCAARPPSRRRRSCRPCGSRPRASSATRARSAPCCSASASDSISWSRESGPGATSSTSFLKNVRLSAGAAALSAPRGGAGGGEFGHGVRSRGDAAEKRSRKLTATDRQAWRHGALTRLLP